MVTAPTIGTGRNEPVRAEEQVMEAMFFSIAAIESRRQTEQTFWSEPRREDASGTVRATPGWFARLRALRGQERHPDRTAPVARPAPLGR